MIPIKLKMNGFLSHKSSEIDFTSFHIACVSGGNGSGKSSILDAITWCLFGKARQAGDNIINTGMDTAEVIFGFEYEGNLYQAARLKKVKKPTMLEFRIRAGGEWKPLTAKSIRKTEQVLQNVLRMDYDTFINASFFVQGKADQFTQQTSGQRKEILGNILGLEVWNSYRELASQKRRKAGDRLNQIDGAIDEIDQELNKEGPRKAYLQQLEENLDKSKQELHAQANLVAAAERIQALYDHQEKALQITQDRLEKVNVEFGKLQEKLDVKKKEIALATDLAKRETNIRAKHEKWLQSRKRLDEISQQAIAFQLTQTERQRLLTTIEAKKSRLQAEFEGLEAEAQNVSEMSSNLPGLNEKLNVARKSLTETQVLLGERETIRNKLTNALEVQANTKSENKRLKIEMNRLRDRIEKIKTLEQAECPACGQSMPVDKRSELVKTLTTEGKGKGDKYRANQAAAKNATAIVDNLKKEIANLKPKEEKEKSSQRLVDQLAERIDQTNRMTKAWETTKKERHKLVQELLTENTYAPTEQAKVARIDEKLEKSGYSPAEHTKIKDEVTSGSGCEDQIRQLEAALAATAVLQTAIEDLNSQKQTRKEEVDELTVMRAEGEAALQKITVDVDFKQEEQKRKEMEEALHRLQLEVGGAKQKVQVLDQMRSRKATLTDERQTVSMKIDQLKALETAFGNSGVPALLIEQAIPEIERKANEILDRLSNGEMTVQIITQKAYKDDKRIELKETLDIQISDPSGTRDYETYSGGEAFRVNFAIRLALAEILAQRAGARLQLLVIDEGFGSQDIDGRQRLIESIEAVKDMFKKILIITHIEELKNTFANRIEVEKTPLGGSTITIV